MTINWPHHLKRAMDKPAEAIRHRDTVIREAHTAGNLSTREIAEIVGKSHAWVHNIVQRKPPNA